MNWYVYALHTPDSLTIFPTVTIFRDEEGSGIELTWLESWIQGGAMSKPEHPHTIQHRNIKKVVRALADLCFGSKNEPKWGVAWLAIVNSLTAKDGLDWMALRLEPLPEVGQAALDTQRLDWMIAKDARLAHSRDGDVCVVWIPDNSDESGGDYKPVEGFPLKPYTTNRAAIDAAMTVLP